MNTDTKGYLDMDLLRFTTAGSVDDGKSTLIGRLLYDCKSIFEDQWDAVEQSSKQRGDENVNLALLTDGLRSEREQGITIDVAYRYFATPKRKFIIADTPGHIQYTRNMVTGASTANLAIILIRLFLNIRSLLLVSMCRTSILFQLVHCLATTLSIVQKIWTGIKAALFFIRWKMFTLEMSIIMLMHVFLCSG